jgi:hypothetical protein
VLSIAQKTFWTPRTRSPCARLCQQLL